jgi:hypothetical protein
MTSRKTSSGYFALPLSRLFVATSLSVLAACGGGGDTGNNSNVNNASETGSSGAKGGSIPSSASAFISSIFLQSGGTGYVSFVSSKNTSSQYTGVASEQLSISTASSTVFNEQTSAVIGQYSATLARQTIVTAAGDFSTLGLGNDIQMFDQDLTGFTFGLGGSVDVFRATLASSDVSGQSISGVATDADGGVAHALATDTAAMPGGSIRYLTQITASAPVLVVQSGAVASSQTLAQLQQQFGGTVATLGDVSYLTGMSENAPASAYAQLNVGVYAATYAVAGQSVPITLLAGTDIAFNQIASSFIVQELKSHAAEL